MSEQELNKKLAEWAGIRYEPDQDVFKVIFPDGTWYNIGQDWKLDEIEPDFTQSLDACFKWLVPKLQNKGHQIELFGFEHKGFRATIYEECYSQRGSDGFDPYLNPKYQAANDTPALALCLAIEKLIDSEVSHE